MPPYRRSPGCSMNSAPTRRRVKPAARRAGFQNRPCTIMCETAVRGQIDALFQPNFTRSRSSRRLRPTAIARRQRREADLGPAGRKRLEGSGGRPAGPVHPDHFKGKGPRCGTPNPHGSFFRQIRTQPGIVSHLQRVGSRIPSISGARLDAWQRCIRQGVQVLTIHMDPSTRMPGNVGLPQSTG